MKKQLSLLLIGTLSLVLAALTIEEGFLERIVKQMDAFQRLNIQEKVYLHLDRPAYTAGETIWFSAYATIAATNTPDTLSRVLYVELLDSENEILTTKRIRMADGLGSGNIFLPDNLPTGLYRIRAYTHWMRNFSEDFFFRRDVQLWAQGDTPKTEGAATTDAGLDIQFMPEGGHLVRELDSKVAFKATNSRGESVSVSGFILNQANDTLVGFRTEHLGMGQFMFKPQSGQQYRILVQKPGGGFAPFPFPAIKESGVVMTVDNLSNKQNVRIFVRSNSANAEEMALIAHNQGDVTYANKAVISSRMTLFTIPKSGIGEGISHLTLFNAQSQPVAERLVYTRMTQPLRIQLTAPETTQPRAKAQVNVLVTDQDGKPVEGNFSVAVTDGNQAGDDPHAQHIVSYLRLEADLRGSIERPADYFDPTNTNADRYLDLLLLTQGWRRFSWKDVFANPKEPNYFVEQGISLTGKLIRKNKRPTGVIPLTFTILQRDSSQLFVQGESIASGEFALYGMDLTDSTDILVQITDKKKAVDVKIQTDLFSPPPVIQIPFRAQHRQLVALDVVERAKEYLRIERTIRENRERLLEEVTIKGKKVDPIANDQRRALYKRPSNTLKFDDRNTVGALTIFDVIRGRIPGVEVIGTGLERTIRIRGNANFQGNIEPMYMIDGNPVNKDVALNLLPASVESIDVIKGPQATVYGDQGRGGVINILTKNGNPDQFALEETEGSHSTRLMGYDPVREFYAPRYDQPAPEHVRPDYRPTLLWLPRLRTSQEGKATFDFFASDSKGPIHLRIEGLSRSGVPGMQRATVNSK
jgi:hypothetical protein